MRQGLGNIWGEIMAHISRSICVGPFWHQLPDSHDGIVLFLVQDGYLFYGGFYDLVLGSYRALGEPFLHLLFLKCLRLKIINAPKQHMLGWHVPNPFICVGPSG